VEIGIVRNHVHLIVELSPTPDIPRLVQGLKGASARIANRDGYMPRARLQWAAGYDFRSIGVNDLQRAIAYVRDQNRRHPDLAIEDDRARALSARHILRERYVRTSDARRSLG
jgi:REP element-mobilizing transposase RayT